MNEAQNEIVVLETKYWDAMKNNDIETAVSLTKFPCTVTGPQGAQRVTESQYRDIMKAADSAKYKGIEIKDAHVDLLNENTALISYQTLVNGMKMLDVSTWVRENGKWICAFHSENPLQ